MTAPAAVVRELRCEHRFTAGLCPYRSCEHAERRAKHLTPVLSPEPVVKSTPTLTANDFVQYAQYCVRFAEVRKLRAWKCYRRWLRGS